MTIEALAAELEKPRYAGKTDVQILELLTTSELRRELVDNWRVADYLARDGRAFKLKVASESHPVTQIKAAAYSALLLLSSQMPQFNFALPDFQELFPAMVAGGVLTQEEVDGLEAMSFTGPAITQDHLNAARLLPRIETERTLRDAARAELDRLEQRIQQMEVGVDPDAE